MTRALSLRSRVPGNWQARFWRPVERGDPSAEFNGETHRGQQVTPALTLPQVRYGLSVLLMEVFCTLSIPSSSTCEVRGRIVRWQTNERPVLLRSTLSISS